MEPSPQKEQSKKFSKEPEIRTMAGDLKKVQEVEKVPFSKPIKEAESLTQEVPAEKKKSKEPFKFFSKSPSESTEKLSKEGDVEKDIVAPHPLPEESSKEKEEVIKTTGPTRFIERIAPPETKKERELSPQERLAYGVDLRRPKPTERPPSTEAPKAASSEASRRPTIFESLKKAPKNLKFSKLNNLVKSKKFLALIILIFVIGGGVFTYYKFYYSSPVPLPPPVILEPEAIIPVEQKIVINYSEGENLLAKVNTELRRMSDLPEISRLNIKDQKGYYLGLEDIDKELNIKIPEELVADIKDYNLFVFSLKGEDLRLGLAFEVTDSQMAKSYTRSWESKMRVNLRTLFLNSYAEAPASLNFQNNVYQNVAIRYLNFPHPYTTIDYAFIGNKLIITTSKASMYRVIDILR